VNTRYQSVQGVTSSMMSPSHISGCSPKNSQPRAHARRGVSPKFMSRLKRVSLRFLSPFLSLESGTPSSTKYSIPMRAGTMSSSAPSDMGRTPLSTSPSIMDPKSS